MGTVSHATHQIISASEGPPFFDLAPAHGHHKISREARALADRIRDELKELHHESRQGHSYRNVEAVLKKLRQVAVRGLASERPDVAGATEDLASIVGVSATHEIRSDKSGDALDRGPEFFTLRQVDGVKAPSEAVALASAITEELHHLEGRAGHHGIRRLRLLRAVAEKGLTNKNPDLEGAKVDLLRAGIRYPLVRASGADDYVIELPEHTSAEQRQFLGLFQNAFNLVRTLHMPPQATLIHVVRRFILNERRSDASHRAVTRDFLPDRDAMLDAARFALPDCGSGRVPEPAIATEQVNRIVADAITVHGPRARSAYLRELIIAYALTLAFFGLLIWLLGISAHATRGTLTGWLPELPQNSRVLGYGLVAMVSLFVGAWLSAAQRVNSTETAVVQTLFSETFDSLMRAGVLLGWGVLTFVVLYKQLVVFNIGPDDVFSTATMFSQLPSAILFGALLGLGERALPNLMIEPQEALSKRLATVGGPTAQPDSPAATATA